MPSTPAYILYHGKATSTKIGVLQVWQKQGGNWKLLAARASGRSHLRKSRYSYKTNPA